VLLSRSSAARSRRICLQFDRNPCLVRAGSPEISLWITQVELVTAIGGIVERPDDLGGYSLLVVAVDCISILSGKGD